MQPGALTEKLAADVSGLRERQSVNITKVKELICSQGDARGTHKSPQEIEQITGIAGSSVVMLTDFLADHIAASIVTTLTDVAIASYIQYLIVCMTQYLIVFIVLPCNFYRFYITCVNPASGCNTK